ncbi:MAG: hypothetical protein DRH32_04850 [Deltaproteobacteria bacterium]|nr:MAG: hypothetical protein DRH32_04850 [Deltaproteobacteria bacterium]
MLYIVKTVFKTIAGLTLALLVVLVPAAHVCGAYEGTAVVRANRLNIRSAPDKNSKKLGVLKKGTIVKVVRDEGRWLKILHEDIAGYIRNSRDYVELDGPPPPKKLQQLKQQALQISKEIENHKKDLKKYGKKETDLVAGLNDIELALNRAETKIRSLQKSIDSISQKIEASMKAAAALEERIEKNRNYAAKRLVALYKLDLVGKMSLLGSADSIFDLLKTKRDIEIICEHDAAILNSFLEDRARLSAVTRKLSNEKQEKVGLERQLKNQLELLSREKARRKRLLSEIRKKESLRQAAIASLRQAAKDLDSTIASLTAKISKSSVQSDGFLHLRGLLKMPVEGKIITKFGKYRDAKLNIVNFRSGIDIKAKQGEPVKAVYKGKVLYADWFKGYGNMIILDHGDGFYTVYAHAMELFKKRGDLVKTGEVIATVGNTAFLGEPSLHFEIRHRGKPEDPLKWLDRG